MAMRRLAVVVFAAALSMPAVAFGQPVQLEADITGGVSTDDVSAAATQVRVFGDAPGGWRLFLEGAWAARAGDGDAATDAFGSAYPYRNRAQAIEAYGERLFRPGKAIVGLRAGRYRTPFGIHTRGDHAYGGFLRAPLIRYDGYFALSNNFLESGAEVVAGLPQLSVTTSVGVPTDVGSSRRRSGLATVSRIQGFHGPWVVGLSHIRSKPYFPARFARGQSVFTGVDVRWTHDGIQVLGEWITGRPFDGTSTDGWHIGVIVHRQGMGPVTAVARTEELDYDALPPRARWARRHTIGARVRLPRHLSAQVNVLHQTGDLSTSARTAADLALTYSLRLP
jgi:hypothetical protein